MKDRPGAESELEPGAERRHGDRVTINKQFDSFDQFVREYVANLSGTGAFVRTDTPLPVGTEIALKFSVVLDGVETIEGVGVVVRVENDPPGMGVVFKELGAYSRKLIERMLLASGS
ncbi:MAG TPA: PilZ domain-containing protein [Polyangiaceae bacterium]